MGIPHIFMANASIHPGGGQYGATIRHAMVVPQVLAYGLLFPALAMWGGSTNLINWGPGLLLAGVACFLLLDKDRLRLSGGALHTGCFLGLLVALLIRARYSADVSAAANSSALIGFAASGFLIGRLANDTKSRALFIGLTMATLLNLVCSVVQINNPEWNLVYPQRSAEFPCGVFAHYSYSAAFCLGSAGLLVSSCLKERAWLRVVFIGGAICALVTIPMTLSRGGNLALAFMIAAAFSLLLSRTFSNSKSVMSTWLPAIILLALILIFVGFLVPMIGRNKGPGGFYTDSCRIDFWNAAMRICANHPWLGGGPGSFAWEVFHVMNGLGTEPGMVHNEALQLAVEYGYPALVFLAVLILVPVTLCLARFVNKVDLANTAWAAIGLLAMLIQSNFESIFHAGPGAFVAALILGQISRSLWGMERAKAPKQGRTHPDFLFISEARNHVNDYLAGSAEALPKLTSLLLKSMDKGWRKHGHDIVFWKKTHNEEAMRQAIFDLKATTSKELRNLSATKKPRPGTGSPKPSSRIWGMVGNLAPAACAIPLMLSGARITQALHAVWVPLYHPEVLPVTQRFEQLFSVVENRPGLGIDRIVLAAARACILYYENQEDRENWATAHQMRILQAIPGWTTDPGSALLIAEIAGWAGDCHSALDFYNHAIVSQGGNELLFKAHSFKGQYLYELCLSAAAVGNTPQQRFFARQAIDCFKDASAALGLHNRKLDPYFVKMQSECETYGTKDM